MEAMKSLTQINTAKCRCLIAAGHKRKEGWRGKETLLLIVIFWRGWGTEGSLHVALVPIEQITEWSSTNSVITLHIGAWRRCFFPVLKALCNTF